MKCVVTIDDAGMHPAVGRAVSILSEKGVVTSASLVATGMDIGNAARLEGVGLGVHLDILRGRPLSHWQEVNSIVDENGAFYGSVAKLFPSYAMGKVDHSHVEKEWRAQIEKVLDLGVKPTHLSSHGHIHAWPTLTRMAGELAMEYGIEWMRKPEECSEFTHLAQSSLESKFLKVCEFFDRETEGVSWPDMLWGVEEQGAQLIPEEFERYIKTTKPDNTYNDIIEICCRPGVTIAGDPPIPSYCGPTEMSSIWRAEFESLAEHDWTETFKSLGMTLVQFGGLE